MVSINNIHFAYHTTPVLKDISFSQGPGKLCGVLGANGSGKTTLLKCLLGIFTPQTGTITVQGKPVVTLAPGKRAKLIAYVPQDTKQYGGGTVFDTVLLGRKPHFGMFPGKADIDMTCEILAELELDDLAMRPIGSLSGGQRQRVCIAKALCQRTPVIVLDEPTANLDIRFKIEIMQLLKNLAFKGKTIIITAHDLNIARTFCHEFVLLKAGKLIAKGDTSILDKRNIEKLYDIEFEQIASLFPGLINASDYAPPVWN